MPFVKPTAICPDKYGKPFVLCWDGSILRNVPKGWLGWAEGAAQEPHGEGG